MKDAQAGDTRERILTAATRLFAEQGYRNTTVAAICRAAGANIASVNYYFGDKESLYRQAWRHAHEQSTAAVSAAGEAGANEPPEKRLRCRIRSGLLRAVVSDAAEFRIIRYEMADPTGLLQEVIEETIRPLRQRTQAILRELLGPCASDRDVELCEVCVVAPWMHVGHGWQARRHHGLAPVFSEDMLEFMTDHFTAFALAGVAETRRRLERRGETPSADES